MLSFAQGTIAELLDEETSVTLISEFREIEIDKLNL